jgi:hypothetical protein
LYRRTSVEGGQNFSVPDKRILTERLQGMAASRPGAQGISSRNSYSPMTEHSEFPSPSEGEREEVDGEIEEVQAALEIARLEAKLTR